MQEAGCARSRLCEKEAGEMTEPLELKRTPLYEEHLALGARMAPFSGWEMPVQYMGIIEEHSAVRTRAGIFDVSHMAEFRVSGSAAFDYLQHVLTNDLERISGLGQAQYTLMLDDSGGIIDDIIVYHSGDLEYLIITNAANHASDLEWLQSHAPEGLELVDESDRTGLIALQGPGSKAVISELAGQDWQLPSRFCMKEAVLGGSVPVLVARTGYTGEDGVEIVSRASDTPKVWRMLLSFSEVVPAGLGARDILRLEMGYALYGSDMDRDVDPISAGLGWVCPKSKAGYIGAEKVAAVRAEGPKKRLAYLRTDGGIPRHGYPVLHDGTEVGMVASGTFSPVLQTGIASAYLPVGLAEIGIEVEIAVRKKRTGAQVVKAPFIEPKAQPGP